MEIKQNKNQDAEIKTIHEFLEKIFNQESDIQKWLNTYNTNLGNTTPLDLIKNGNADKVRLFLEYSLEGN
jgi:hypothetical protein